MAYRLLQRALVTVLVALSAGAAWAQGAANSAMEPKVAACIACHGREGAVSAAAYFPRLAGKPAGYLFNQLQSFRDGRRLNSDMAHLVRNMTDDYLKEIAQYFADLDLPYPTVAQTSDASTAMLARGAQLVRAGDPVRGIPACASCHGAALTGVQPGIPGLVGLPRLYLASQLGDWLDDNRHAKAPDCMSEVARKLTAADVNAVASWLALQPVPADAKAKPLNSVPASLPMPCSAVQP
ncbi:c-type cytochrome [Variovorax sp. J22R133]|uniref:c-type cytochrome n=1 Tax=Variovorax brevis TaxID=3053503 RepID=UPI002575B8F1|nr:c-type cytochrome [Variovorax sp. J22R133]MDM0115144.1 c-type cytochrome [Variovorax sp. J22R133]